MRYGKSEIIRYSVLSFSPFTSFLSHIAYIFRPIFLDSFNVNRPPLTLNIVVVCSNSDVDHPASVFYWFGGMNIQKEKETMPPKTSGVSSKTSLSPAQQRLLELRLQGKLGPETDFSSDKFSD